MLNRKRIIPVTMLFLVSMSILANTTIGSAAGNSYYVSPTGSDSNSGTIGNPWRNLSFAVNVARAGDTIFMRGGDHAMGEVWIRRSRDMGGKPGQPLTIKAYPGEKPILAGSRRLIIDADYVRVEGLNFIMPWTATGWGTGIEIVSNTFTGAQPKYGAISMGGIDVLIEGNLIQYDDSGGNTMDHGIYIHRGQRITVRNNRVIGSKGYGIHVYDEQKSSDPAVWAANPFFLKDIIIEGNIVSASQSRSGIIVAKGRGGAYIALENITLRNNILFGNALNGILIRNGDQVKVFNNTIYNNGSSAIAITGSSSTPAFDPSDVQVSNNIISAPAGVSHIYVNSSGANIVVNNNFYDSGPRISGASDPNAVLGNPLFVNPETQDFHLQEASPAIDVGLTLAEVPVDKDGVVRPQGSAFDMGAYEFAGGGPTPTFADVPFIHWAHDSIESLYQAGYISGCSTTPLLYCPEAGMTRAESAVFVVRGVQGAGYVPPDPTQQVFADVPLSEWYAKWAGQLWEDGYTAGCGTNPLVYCPTQEHTRTEGTVFFLRMLHGSGFVPPDPIGIFADVDVSFWGARWIEAAYNAGLIPACQTDPLLFCPDEALDRAMGAYMMVQAKGLNVP
ncbi:MAG: right-handed parallel beta-helix repeat-containing protein [Chloroflexi bacterium]|nr:right-handed parallel beta-helix repeat-containing protein [Chloroflexota bacterium]